MGAWGYGPFDNDSALDWVQGEVQPRVLAILVEKMEAYSRDKHNDVVKHQAEAAVAILLLLCDPNRTATSQCVVTPDVTLCRLARQQGVLTLGSNILEDLLGTETWLKDWSDPAIKSNVLREMLNALRALATAIDE